MAYPIFDRSQLQLRPLAERVHDFTRSEMLNPGDALPALHSAALDAFVERVLAAHRRGKPLILMHGGHVVKQGLGRLVIDLMERGIVQHVAMNGSGPIHEYELALIGATTESVARYITEGQFGLWQETGRLNDVAAEAARTGMGLGEAFGRFIAESGLPYSADSILAAGWRLRVPVTVHVGIGQDIIHEHPNCDGAAYGAASYTDFLVFTQSLAQLQGGALLAVSSHVMAPEVFLKSLAMVRNVARQRGEQINRFATAVFDLPDLGPDPSVEAARDSAEYFFRPYKTLLVRTVADGGESFYVRGQYRDTFAAFHQRIVAAL